MRTWQQNEPLTHWNETYIRRQVMDKLSSDKNDGAVYFSCLQSYKFYLETNKL